MPLLSKCQDIFLVWSFFKYSGVQKLRSTNIGFLILNYNFYFSISQGFLVLKIKCTHMKNNIQGIALYIA